MIEGVMPPSSVFNPLDSSEALVGGWTNSIMFPPGFRILRADGTLDVIEEFDQFTTAQGVTPLAWFANGHAVIGVTPIAICWDFYDVELASGQATWFFTACPVGMGWPVFSPDGSRFIADISTGGPPSPPAWLLFDSAGQFIAQINPDDGFTRGSPVWSPDGRKIAWEGGPMPSGEIAMLSVLDLETLDETPLVPFGPALAGGIVGKHWAADNETIVYGYDKAIRLTNIWGDFNYILYTRAGVRSATAGPWSPRGDSILAAFVHDNWMTMPVILPAPPLPVPPPWRRGDLDEDEDADHLDGLLLIGLVFGSGPAVEPLDRADVNDDGFIGVADAVRLFGYLEGGAPPAPPFDVPGWDSTLDGL